ncbi:MAG: hypothetical protein H0V66_10540 [Bdellovibrionales bacterium]|nr:hypothetical protein [Bdellovibrionales bacterium]
MKAFLLLALTLSSLAVLPAAYAQVETQAFTLHRLSLRGKKVHISKKVRFDSCTDSNSIYAIASKVDYGGL